MDGCGGSTAGMTRTRIRPVRLGPAAVSLQVRADGSQLLRAVQPLGPCPVKLTDRLLYWADRTPQQLFLAMRGPDGAWQKLSYAETRERVLRVAAALVARPLSAGRPVAILSDNSLHHAVLALAAQHVGIPYAPVSAAYSLVKGDLAKLRHILGLLTPGLVYAEDGQRYARAIRELVPADAELVVGANPPAERPATLFAELLATPPTVAAESAAAGVGPARWPRSCSPRAPPAYPKA